MIRHATRPLRLAGALLPLLALAAAARGEPSAEPAAKMAGASAPGRAGHSPEFRAWVDARAGTGQPVHWVAEGGVYEYPSGRKLFGMVGFDSSRVVWPQHPGEPVLHLTRKTFAYTDPQSGEILREYNGKPVAPIAYPYQMITYREEGDQIFAEVEQGVGKGVQIIRQREGIRYRWLGKDTLAVTAPIFLDAPLPNGGRYEAWENYDFFLHRPGKLAQPYQMSWQRFGSLPPWAGTGKAIYHLVSWRVEREDEFPPALLAWARAAMPLWLKPPADVAEVRRLQRGEGGEAWAK
ncbi:MAG: hypothetical protein KGL54_00815 [Sphingomonadales bacterium]|nr:hypothetical protein [Sphingomonadales bacterium]